MEDLLPLLIGVIWLAFTLYSRGQKKKNAKPTGGKQAQPKAPSLLEQILMGQQIQVPEPEPYVEYEEEVDDEPQPVYQPIEKKETFIPVSNAFLSSELFDIDGEGQHAFNYEIEEDEPMDIKDLYDVRKESVLDEDFDLRKAIIYEAVLNPPYIDFK